MKKLILSSLVLLLSAGIAISQISVQGSQKVNTDFKKYRTFGWLNDNTPERLVKYTYEEIAVPTEKKGRPRNGEVIVYSYSFFLPSSDSMVNKTLTRSIENELEGRGYRKTSTSPDLVVAFKVFDNSTKIKGYDNAPTKVGASETYTPKDTVTYALKPGSVYVSLIDSKTSQVVWEGSASGVTKNGAVITDKMKLKEAVNLIFQKYSFRGDNVSMNE